MKILKSLFVLGLSVLYFHTSLMSKEILEILSPVITSLMKEKNIPEIQLLLFRPEEIKSLQYKRDFKNQRDDVFITNQENEYNNFFISELSYPFINFIIESKKDQIFLDLEEVLKEDVILKSIYDSMLNLNQTKIYFYDIDSSSKNRQLNPKFLFLDCLLNMLCGIELSRNGISIKELDKNETLKIRVIDKPFEHFYLSTYNYYLLEKLFNHTYEDTIQFINQYISSQNLKHTFIHRGKVDNELLIKFNVVRGSFSDKKITYVPDLIILNPLSYGMISNVYDYYKILQILISQKNIFEGFYTLDEETGGYRNGFFYRKSCDEQFYIAESFGIFPGIRTYVFLMQNGYGFILFQSSDNEYVINFLREQIENLYYRILNINCNFESPKTHDIKHLTGYYRPLNVVDTTIALFSDIWIRENDLGQLEVSNFFNKDPAGYLYFYNRYNYFLGLTRLNRYPVIYRNDTEKKLLIGIYEYQKIYWFQSIRGIILIFYGMVLFISLIFIRLILKHFRAEK